MHYLGHAHTSSDENALVSRGTGRTRTVPNMAEPAFNPRVRAEGFPFYARERNSATVGNRALMWRSCWQDSAVIELARLVEGFAAGLGRADGRGPQAIGSRTGHVYRRGIGPHTEAQLRISSSP